MIITGKHLPRRTFLKGIGTAIALPLLESMVPVRFGSTAAAAAADSAAQAVGRLALVYVPNGIVMDNWTPEKTGADFEYTRILKPIEKFRDRTMVISGLNNYNADALGDGAGDHARAGAAFLTCSHPKKTGGSDIHAGVSVDQVIAQTIGNQTRLASLEIGLDDNRTIGHCDSGYSSLIRIAFPGKARLRRFHPSQARGCSLNGFSGILIQRSTLRPAPAAPNTAKASWI